MTSLAAERAEQKRWRERLRRPAPAYDTLLEHEFHTAELHEARQRRDLAVLLRFTSQSVGYYRKALSPWPMDAINANPRSVLATLPVLTKLEVQDNSAALQPATMPRGERASGWLQSSGTTGRPVQVLHSTRTNMMFTALKQREYRWFRFDPAGTLAALRVSSHLPRGADGRELKSGETARAPAWPYMSNFATGPYIGMSTDTPAEERIQWLRRERPDYLIAYAQTLEHLAFAARGECVVPGLKGALAISEQLTPAMRTLAEQRFVAPVHQNYGLNEIGLVAARCEAGRYHVHSEHCLVEIVDEAGNACAPGQTGRLIVTSLTNVAMPLIRYDSGDLAEAVGGECACGRTLPSFGDIVGRYSRVAYLRPGTIGQMLALRDAVEQMPAELSRDLREFQIHQFRDQRFELRLVARAPLPDGFTDRVRTIWAAASVAGEPKLTISYVDAIARSPGGKFQVFTSDFMPAPDAQAVTSPS